METGGMRRRRLIRIALQLPPAEAFYQHVHNRHISRHIRALSQRFFNWKEKAEEARLKELRERNILVERLRSVVTIQMAVRRWLAKARYNVLRNARERRVYSAAAITRKVRWWLRATMRKRRAAHVAECRRRAAVLMQKRFRGYMVLAQKSNTWKKHLILVLRQWTNGACRNVLCSRGRARSELERIAAHSSTLQRIAFQRIATHCSAVYCSAAHCSAAQCNAMQRIVLQRIAAHCSAMQCNAMQRIVLYCSALFCSASFCSALHCSGLQCSAVQCNVLQRIAAHCKAL
jgi:hypothetical protein